MRPQITSDIRSVIGNANIDGVAKWQNLARDQAVGPGSAGDEYLEEASRKRSATWNVTECLVNCREKNGKCNSARD